MVGGGAPRQEKSIAIEKKDNKNQMKHHFDSSFWNSRWEMKHTGWDIGSASPPIKTFMSQYSNKSAALLIPGCGNAYEAEFLVKNGFTNITLMDIAPKAVEQLKEKFKGQDQVHILCEDFFDHRGQYDLMIEQTFFCAHPPESRRTYVEKAVELLKKEGKLMGVLFKRNFEKQGPPFGGTIEEYRSLFSPYFTLKKMEDCYNSIAPRLGHELFIHLIRK